MNRMKDEQLEEYYREAESWSHDRLEATQRSLRLAWTAAAVAAGVALLEAVALILLVTQPSDPPYVITVDSQTGYVQPLRPFEDDGLTADAALTRSFLVQYVVAR